MVSSLKTQSMKAINMILKSSFTFLLLLCVGSQLSAQQADKKMIGSAIESRHFLFVAQSLSPTGSGVRQLTPGYTVKLSGDTLVTSLPYIGRAYSAPINPAEGGFNFTSTHFQLNPKTRKKGGWNLSIVPKDARDVRELAFTIFENGSASLQVTSNNRQPISYNGYVRELQAE
jgi:hypothetical protein